MPPYHPYYMVEPHHMGRWKVPPYSSFGYTGTKGAIGALLKIHGRRVGIYVDTRRKQCRPCNKTCYERLPNGDGKRMMTSRLVEWVGKQSVKLMFGCG